MKNFLLHCLLCCKVFFANAQVLRTAVPVYLKLGAYSSHKVDASCFQSNPASLVSLKNFSAAVYGERKFMLKDLAQYRLGLALPTTSGNFGMQVFYSGNPLLNGSGIGLAYGRSVGKLDVGMQFNYSRLQIVEYGNAPSMDIEGGLLLHGSEKFLAGIHLCYPLNIQQGEHAERLPMVYSTGFGYDVSDALFIGCEVEKEEDQPLNVQAGLQYAFDRKLFLRTGFASAASQFYLGLGFLLEGVRIDVAATLHPQLGLTPAILLIYNASKK